MGRRRLCGKRYKSSATPFRSDNERKIKLIVGGIFIVACSGPLLCLIIQQVCVSKCLLVKRLPRMNSEVDDLLLVALFVFYVIVNYVTLCMLWTMFRKGLRALYLKTPSVHPSMTIPPFMARWILMDTKIPRSCGRSYGYRRA